MKNVLLDKGIILPSGAISKDKINLVAGATTQNICLTKCNPYLSQSKRNDVNMGCIYFENLRKTDR